MAKGGLIGLIVLLLLALPASAFKAGVFVDYPNGLEHDCVEIGDGARAKQILDESKFSAEYSYGGAFLDSIGGIANDFSTSRSWWFYHGRKESLALSDVGLADYGVSNDLGFVYFGYYKYGADFTPTESPEDVSFFDACPDEANSLTVLEVFVDTGDQSYLDTNDTIVYGTLGQKMILLVRLTNEVEIEGLDEAAYEITGTVKFTLAGENFEEDFDIGPDETETVAIPFDFPFDGSGSYRGFVYIDGADEFKSYSAAKRVLFGVGRQLATTTMQSTTTTATSIQATTIPSATTQSTTTIPASPITGEAVSEPSAGTGVIVAMCVLGALLLGLLVVLFVVIRK
jgi:hypothetical protein